MFSSKEGEAPEVEGEGTGESRAENVEGGMSDDTQQNDSRADTTTTGDLSQDSVIDVA